MHQTWMVCKVIKGSTLLYALRQTNVNERSDQSGTDGGDGDKGTW